MSAVTPIAGTKPARLPDPPVNSCCGSASIQDTLGLASDLLNFVEHYGTLEPECHASTNMRSGMQIALRTAREAVDYASELADAQEAS